MGTERRSTRRPTVAIGPPSPGSHGTRTLPRTPPSQVWIAATNASPIATMPVHPAALPRRRSGRTSAISRNAASGSARTRSGLPTEEVEAIGVDGPAHAEDDDDEGEADGHFRHRDRDGEHREEQAHGIAVHPREGNQIDVDRVQHELDAEEDPDGVAPGHHAEETDREHEGGDDQVR